VLGLTPRISAAALVLIPVLIIAFQSAPELEIPAALRRFAAPIGKSVRIR
jgi:hypothetical protein